MLQMTLNKSPGADARYESVGYSLGLEYCTVEGQIGHLEKVVNRLAILADDSPKESGIIK